MKRTTAIWAPSSAARQTVSAAGRFTLNGTEYRLAANDRGNCLHGGIRGFDKRMEFQAEMENGVIFSRLSPDGEEGYPGNLHGERGLHLTEDNALRIEYDAYAMPTPR
jgi:aldose 1-epimerase